jgi:hypothetical protein
MCSRHGGRRSRPRGPAHSGLPHRPLHRLKSRARGCKRRSTTPTASLETRDPGRAPQGAASLAQRAQAVEAARQAPHRLSGQRAQGTERLRAIGHASHGVDLERGVRRNGTRMAADLHGQSDTIRSSAQPEGLSQAGRDRLQHAQRVVPTRQATIACGSRAVRQQGGQLHVAQPQAYALHAPLMPAFALERVASTRTVTEGQPLRERATPLRTPLCEPGGRLAGVSHGEPHQIKAEAATLAEVCQRSRSHGAGRNGSLALRNPQLRGLDHPRKRAGLTAVHNFLLTRSDGTTAAERFFGQKPRSMFAAILASVERPPAPLSPLRRAVR